jgi:hypothetical protein
VSAGLSVAWQGGGDGRVVSLGGESVTVRSSKPFAPGSRPEGPHGHPPPLRRYDPSASAAHRARGPRGARPVRPHGRTLVKPNLVAAGELFKHAFTRPEFVEGVLLALRDRDEGR